MRWWSTHSSVRSLGGRALRHQIQARLLAARRYDMLGMVALRVDGRRSEGADTVHRAGTMPCNLQAPVVPMHAANAARVPAMSRCPYRRSMCAIVGCWVHGRARALVVWQLSLGDAAAMTRAGSLCALEVLWSVQVRVRSCTPLCVFGTLCARTVERDVVCEISGPLWS